MSQNSYKETVLKLVRVEAKVENWEGDGWTEKEYFEIRDDEDNVYLKIDDLADLIIK